MLTHKSGVMQNGIAASSDGGCGLRMQPSSRHSPSSTLMVVFYYNIKHSPQQAPPLSCVCPPLLGPSGTRSLHHTSIPSDPKCASGAGLKTLKALQFTLGGAKLKSSVTKGEVRIKMIRPGFNAANDVLCVSAPGELERPDHPVWLFLI